MYRVVQELVLKPGNDCAFYHFLCPGVEVSGVLSVFLVVILKYSLWLTLKLKRFEVYDKKYVSEYPTGEFKNRGC